MKNMPKRDISGECEGECRDRVFESEKERQAEIASASVDVPDFYTEVPWAKSRNAPPGWLGGHV